MNSLTIYQRDLSRCQPLSREESFWFFVAWHSAGYLPARQRLIESVLRMAYAAAQKFACPRASLLDLILEANQAAILAVEYWNPAKGPLEKICRSFICNAMKKYLWKVAHNGIYIPITTLKAAFAGQLDARTPRRRAELRNAAQALGMRRFSELTRDDPSPFDVPDECEADDDV